MPAKSRPIVVPSLIATAAVVLAGAWMLGSEPSPLGVCRLPDGTVLRLDVVTLGPEHRFVKGRYGQRLLAAVLPSASKGVSGAATFAYHSTNPPGIIFWTSDREMPFRPRPGKPAYLMRSLDGAACVVLSDERGSSVRATSRLILMNLSFSPGVRTGPGEFERGYPLPAFPRRGRRLTLRIYRMIGPPEEAPVAEFSVPNPDPGPHPTWKPEPLPITRRDGDLEFTLIRLIAGADPPAIAGGRSMPVINFQFHPRSWTDASFRVARGGKPASEWEPVGMTVSDATGNVVTPVNTLHYLKDGEAHFAFPGHLPADESAWKLRAEFVPTTGFASADLWTVRGIRLPQVRQWTRTGASAVRHGVPLDLALELSRHPGGGPVVVNTRATPLIDGVRIGLVRATDDRGREWTPMTASRLAVLPDQREFEQNDFEVIAPAGRLTDSDSWRPEPMRSYGLQVPADVKTLALTFAVLKSRFVEFVAKPSRP